LPSYAKTTIASLIGVVDIVEKFLTSIIGLGNSSFAGVVDTGKTPNLHTLALTKFLLEFIKQPIRLGGTIRFCPALIKTTRSILRKGKISPPLCFVLFLFFEDNLLVLMCGLCEVRCVLRDSLFDGWDKKMGGRWLGECMKNEARRGEIMWIYIWYRKLRCRFIQTDFSISPILRWCF
jgi:hypothetical protein